MKQRRPSFIIFDLGNVLIHIHPIAFLQSLSIDTPENRAYYHTSIADIVKRYERGDESTQDFFDNLNVLFNSPGGRHHREHGGKKFFSEDEFRRAMLSIVGTPVDGMEEIVRRVSSSVPLGLLSNTNPIHFDYCLQNFHLLRYISSRFLSYKLNAFKPEPEIFARVIDQIPYTPADVLYVDDLPENVEAARVAGFVGHHFTGLANIQHHFSELNLL